MKVVVGMMGAAAAEEAGSAMARTEAVVKATVEDGAKVEAAERALVKVVGTRADSQAVDLVEAAAWAGCTVKAVVEERGVVLLTSEMTNRSARCES